MTSTRRVLFAVLLLSLAACHPDFKIGTYHHQRGALSRRAGGVPGRPLGQRRFGVREAHDRPARARHAPAALALVSRREPHQRRNEWVLAAHELHAPRRELPRRHAGGRRRARGGARRTRSSGASRRSIRRTARRAETAYNTLLGLFPQLAADRRRRKKELADLEEMFAQKNYLSGMYYLRRKAYDSAIIYFKDVVAKYPTDAVGADGAAPTGGRLQGDPLQGRRR